MVKRKIEESFEREHIFTIDRDRNWSYKDLCNYALLAENFFRANGIKRIMLCLPQGFEAYSLIIGAYLAGITFCPTHYENPVNRIKYCIECYRPQLVITDRSDITMDEINVIDFDAFYEMCKSINANRHVADNDIERVAYVMFTSGSSGKPKGVAVSREALDNFLESAENVWGLQDGDIMGQFSSLGFDLSIADIFLSCMAGITLIPIESKSQKLMPAKMIKKYGITFWHSVPSVVDLIVKANQLNRDYIGTLRKISFCGEKLYQSQLEKLFEVCPKLNILNTYGPTEATIFCSYIELNNHNFKAHCDNSVSIGKPVRGISFDVENIEDGIGELVIHGCNVADGYLDNNKNSGAFIENAGGRAYRTGDYVYYKGKDLFFAGRKDTQIKHMGNRVDLSEVDEQIRELGSTSVTTMKNDRIISFVETSNEMIVKIRKHLEENLPAYYIPQEIIAIKDFPHLPSGKVDINKLFEEIQGGYKYGDNGGT